LQVLTLSVVIIYSMCVCPTSKRAWATSSQVLNSLCVYHIQYVCVCPTSIRAWATSSQVLNSLSVCVSSSRVLWPILCFCSPFGERWYRCCRL